MSFRILHLATDEKFMQQQLELFESAFPACNNFRILRRDAGNPGYVRPSARLAVVDSDHFMSPAGERELAEAECILFHAMPRFDGVAERIPERALVVWAAWGADYYRILEARYGSAILERSRELDRSITLRRTLRDMATPRKWPGLLMNRRRKTASLLRTLITRIDAVTINRVDYDRLKPLLPGFRADWHYLCYYTTEDTLEKGPSEMNGPDLLVGNSATPTNNHVEVFEALRGLKLEGRRVIVPLSYGDADYGDHIEQLGAKMFGSSFLPLRDFLALEDYNAIVADCGTVIMNHVRQQAYGNICSALYKGARVYLRQENPVFQYLTSIGITVHPVSDLSDRFDDRQRGETVDARTENARIMGEYWSRKRAISQIRQLERFYLAKHGGTAEPTDPSSTGPGMTEERRG